MLSAGVRLCQELSGVVRTYQGLSGVDRSCLKLSGHTRIARAQLCQSRRTEHRSAPELCLKRELECVGKNAIISKGSLH